MHYAGMWSGIMRKFFLLPAKRLNPREFPIHNGMHYCKIILTEGDIYEKRSEMSGLRIIQY